MGNNVTCTAGQLHHFCPKNTFFQCVVLNTLRKGDNDDGYDSDDNLIFSVKTIRCMEFVLHKNSVLI
jgi:hypothetical protein